MVETWKFPQMWTFTVNPAAYPDQRRVLEWIKEKRCVSEMIRALDRNSLLASREFYAVMEFQDGSRKPSGAATEQVHFHVLLDTKGFISHAEMWALWESKAAPWRACGEPMNKHCPAMGFVRFDKVYQGEGLAAYLSKGVAGYLSKGVKNLPEWFVKYLDDGHNMQLKYASRGFFKSLPKAEKKYTRKPVSGKRKRRTISERLDNCKHHADVYMMVDDKPIWIDSTVWNWETTLERLANNMSPEQLDQCKKLGRVDVTAAELIEVAGFDAYKKLLAKNEGVPVGLARYTENQKILLKKLGYKIWDVGDGAASALPAAESPESYDN